MRQTSRSVQNRVLRKKIRQFYNEQFKSRKFDRVRNEEECVKTLASLEQTLLAMRCHLEVGRDLLGVYACLGATYIGGGLTANTVLPVLDVYRSKVNELLKSVMFDGSRRALADLQGQVDAVRDDLKNFVGQAMVLPLSLEVFTDAKVRDCRVVIDYGGKLTTIHGTHFSGRCSRILLDLHPGSEPKISLAYRKTVMGIFIKEKIVGQAKHNRILGGAESPGCFNVELLFTEDQVGHRVITARACLQVEWFPKLAE